VEKLVSGMRGTAGQRSSKLTSVFAILGIFGISFTRPGSGGAPIKSGGYPESIAQ
jgi:hypothetical protein